MKEKAADYRPPFFTSQEIDMSLNSFITLGRSGLRVSPLCLGSMTFGEDLGWGASVTDSETMIATYLERGGNFIDTANVYTNGHSEKIIGDFFAKKGNRDPVVIGTKFCCSLFEGDPNGGGAGRKALIQQCEASLRRLQTDYIDIYWLHIWDRTAPIEETLRGLDDLVASGKVRYIGFSNLPAWKVSEAQTIAHFRGWTPIIAVQLEYSLLERTAEGECSRWRRRWASASCPGRRSSTASCRASSAARTPVQSIPSAPRWAFQVRRIISSLTRSAPWPRRLAQQPPPSRWHGCGAAQASN